MQVHWDDVEAVAIADGDLRGTRWRLGAAAGTTRTGLSRYRLGPGERAGNVAEGERDAGAARLAGESGLRTATRRSSSTCSPARG